jgi:hypothetical protein
MLNEINTSTNYYITDALVIKRMKRSMISYPLVCSPRQFCFTLLQQFGLQDLSPQPSETHFFEWWNRAAELVDQRVKKGLDSIFTLGACTLWRHKIDCVFNAMVKEEAWR